MPVRPAASYSVAGSKSANRSAGSLALAMLGFISLRGTSSPGPPYTLARRGPLRPAPLAWLRSLRSLALSTCSVSFGTYRCSSAQTHACQIRHILCRRGKIGVPLPRGACRRKELADGGGDEQRNVHRPARVHRKIDV